MAKPTVEVLEPGRETAEQYAHLFVQLKRAGTPIPDNDLWIAALALEHGLTLIPRDRHFRNIPQLLRGKISRYISYYLAATFFANRFSTGMLAGKARFRKPTIISSQL